MRNRSFCAFLALSLLYLLSSCATTPKPEEKPPETVVEKPPEKPTEKPPEKPVEKPKPVTEEELAAARRAITRAKEADAAYYEPQLLQEAEKAYSQAAALKDSNPDESRRLLAETIAKADGAFSGSVQKTVEALRTRMARMDAQLKAIQAPQFLPGEYQDAVSGIERSEKLYQEGKLFEAREEAYTTLGEMSALYRRLDERLRWIAILRRDINQSLKEAEILKAYQRTPEEYEKVNRLYLQGIEAFQKYQLEESEQSLQNAREAAQEMNRLARLLGQEDRDKTRKMMLEVMGELEDASTLTVVTEDGTVIKPEPWEGKPFIEGVLEEGEKGETEKKPGARSLVPASPELAFQGLALPTEGKTVVMGDVSEENLLAQAKELWKQGVAETRKGNYDLAQQYFSESRKLTEIYRTQRANSQTPIYVVRLIPQRRDCLWRIAEYKYIFGNPWLWPKIWRRNKKLISKPDLIYPNWKLVIPPEN